MKLKKFESRNEFIKWISKHRPVLDAKDLKVLLEKQQLDFPYSELWESDFKEFYKVFED